MLGVAPCTRTTHATGAPSGHVVSATRTCRVGLLAQHADTDEPTNTEHHPYMRDMLVDQAFLLRAAGTVRPST